MIGGPATSEADAREQTVQGPEKKLTTLGKRYAAKFNAAMGKVQAAGR